MSINNHNIKIPLSLKKLKLGYFVKQDYSENILKLENKNDTNEILELNDLKTLSSNKLRGYSKIQELKLINIRLASSQRILEWAEKVLPNGKIFGEVLNANTLHYKTFKPHKGGLFCERIFGPLKDFECACGIKQKPADSENYVQTLLNTKKSQRNFCPNCDVEYTWSVIRRYQLGYIKLISPVTHLWYLKTNPSYLSLLFDIRKKDLESIIYCMEITTLEYYWKPLYSIQLNLNPSNLFTSYKSFFKLNAQNGIIQFTRKKIKKKKEKSKRRKALIIKRPSMYFVSSTSKDVELLNTKSLQEKITHLEKSFQLSTTDLYTKKLEKISTITRFLQQRLAQKTKKHSFLVVLNKLLCDLYLETGNLFFNRLSDNLENSNQFLNFKQDVSFNKLTKNFKAHYRKSNSSSKVNYSLTYILKKKLDLKKSKIDHPTSFKKVKNFNSPPFTINDLKVKYRESKGLFFNFQTKDFLLTLKNETINRKTFLSHFFKLIRLTNFKNSWTSVYQDEHASIEFLSDFIISEYKLTSKMQFGKFFKNCLFLYFLFMLQESNDSFLHDNLEKFKNSTSLTKLLNKLYLKQATPSKLLKELSNLQEDNKTVEKQFLHKVLQTNLLLEINEEHLRFFELESISKNINHEYNIFKNLFLNNFIRIFVEFKNFKKEKFKNVHPDNKRLIGLIKLKNKNEKSDLFNKNSGFLSSSYLKAFSYDKSREMEIFFKQLTIDKKVVQFLNSTDFYPKDYTLYLKHRLQINRNVKVFKTQKSQNEFNLCNRIYTLSYFKSWENEREWKYFLYYSTNPIEISDKLQFYYKTYFENVTLINNSNSLNIPVIGANLIQNLLIQYEGKELKKMAKHHQNILPKFNRYIRLQKQQATTKFDFSQIQKWLQKRDQFIRRLKLLRKLDKKNSKSSAMVLKTLPVLPPDLRPILKLQNQIAASDLNRFYQRIIYRNDRLKKFLKMNSILLNSEPGFEIKYGQRLLQEAVDNLIQNGKGSVMPETNSRGQPLKSLSEILKGKQGRFRQYLLGKRVDYSGRSVIVVGPTLKIYQCGLPFEMAMELFLPFLIKRIFQYQLARTVIGAKTILKTQKKITWDLLEEIMYNHPILLNRAPTLHRLGIQAFQPKLIEGRAILLHPLVCPAFNADFDGDQMAVHVPITVEARTEAWKLMLSRNHLISPATGEPMLLPSQDMVLGCYYLTTETLQYSRTHLGRPFVNPTRFYFSNMTEILQLYLQEKIHLQTPVWLKWNSKLQMSQQTSQPLEIRLESTGQLVELKPKVQKRLDSKGQVLFVFIRTTAGRVIFNRLIERIIKN